MSSIRIPFLIIALSLPGLLFAEAPAADSVRASVLQIAKQQSERPSGDSLTGYPMETLYRGLLRAAIATGNASCLATVIELGQQSGWSPPLNPEKPEEFALGYAWTQVYRLDPARAERLSPTQKSFEAHLSNPSPELPASAAPTLAALLSTVLQSTNYEKVIELAYSNFGDTSITRNPSDARRALLASRDYASLPLVIENLPRNSTLLPPLRQSFKKYSQRALEREASRSETQIGSSSELIGLANTTYGFAWGIHHGLLEQELFETRVWENWQALARAFSNLEGQLDNPEVAGSILCAGSAILDLLGASSATPPEALLAKAEALLASDKSPRAYARFVPERKDDIAWENDKVAFRIYGPALANSIESSGIDVWCKRVPYPIINHWYKLNQEKGLSYHQDRGEGYDAFKVGDSRGCGGVALWIHGIPVHSNTFYDYDILWTKGDELAFRTFYKYLNFNIDSNGTPFYEERAYHLRLGERLNRVAVRYRQDSGPNKDGTASLPFTPAIGLFQQSTSARLIRDEELGIYAWSDQLDGKAFFSAVLVDPSIVVESLHLPHKGQPQELKHFWIHVQLDQNASFEYRTGFAWAGDGEINSAEDWLTYLETQARP